MKNNDLAIDITNIKNSLKKYQDAYEKTVKKIKEKKK